MIEPIIRFLWVYAFFGLVFAVWAVYVFDERVGRTHWYSKCASALLTGIAWPFVLYLIVKQKRGLKKKTRNL